MATREHIATPKRIFFGLLLLLSLLLILALYLLINLYLDPEAPGLHYAILGLLIVLGLGAIAAIFALNFATLSLLRGVSSPLVSSLVKKIIIFLYPLVTQLGRFLNISQEKIQSSFIEANNKLVEAENIEVTPKQLLVLLPHCLQDENCPHKITHNPYNCRRCGKCPIDKVLTLSEKWGVNVQIVTGGTLARSIVKSFKPQFILAVACERDLSSGILDSAALPVCGVINDRPMGPCRNTLVSLESLEEKLQMFLGKG